MKNMNICLHTKLYCTPPKVVERPYRITRGATAVLSFVSFDFTSKFDFISNVDEVTFMMKQNRKLFKFNLIEYFKLSEDIIADASKTYYVKEADSESVSGYSYYEYEPQKGEMPKNNYYELVYIKDGEVIDDWQLGGRFRVDDGKLDGNYCVIISLTLSGTDTAKFTETPFDAPVPFEVSIRYNTDSSSGFNKQDSIIIKRQPPIIVIDSLMSDDSATYDDGLYCSNGFIAGSR